jgi:hypothetical protein
LLFAGNVRAYQDLPYSAAVGAWDPIVSAPGVQQDMQADALSERLEMSRYVRVRGRTGEENEDGIDPGWLELMDLVNAAALSRSMQRPMPQFSTIPNVTQTLGVHVLGNQLPFAVPLGPVEFLYSGARVSLTVMNPGRSRAGPSQIVVSSGWLPEMLIDPLLPQYAQPLWSSQSLLKAELYVRIVPADVVSCACTFSYHQYTGEEAQCTCDDRDDYRYALVDNRGVTHTFVPTPTETGAISHLGGPDRNGNYTRTYDPLRTQFWSQDGQMQLDITNPCLPVIHGPDGSTEEFHGVGVQPLCPRLQHQRKRA